MTEDPATPVQLEMLRRRRDETIRFGKQQQQQHQCSRLVSLRVGAIRDESKTIGRVVLVVKQLN